ncbi:MAG: hypothetical protein AAGG38_08560 [Planctomycetota bacterium]
MPRRATKKKTPAAQAADPPRNTGAELFAEIQQQCDAIKTWHEDASARLDERHAELAAYADTLRQTQQGLDRQQAELAQARAALEDQTRAERDQLAALRVELDGEWDQLRGLRRAQEKLGQALDAERKRQNRHAFKLGPEPNQKQAA